MLDPGDVRIPELEAVMFGCEELRRMALEGYSESEMSVALGWPRESIRNAAKVMGFSVSPMILRQELCPACGFLLMPDGHCEICALNLRLERMGAVNDEETARIRQHLEDQIDVLKQERKRYRVAVAVDSSEAIVSAMLDMKPLYLLNPRLRKREWRWFELAANRMLRVAREQQKNGGSTKQRVGALD